MGTLISINQKEFDIENEFKLKNKPIFSYEINDDGIPNSFPYDIIKIKI